MSSANCNPVATSRRASVFAALGDPTRLSLVIKLCRGERRSISELTRGSRLTRQAIRKHLRVLQSAGLVNNNRSGRENLFELDPRRFFELRDYLEFVSAEWDRALARLKSLVER